MYPKNKLEIACYFFIFFICILALFYAKTDFVYFNNIYASKAGLITWLSFFALLSNSIIAFYRIYILKPFRRSNFIIMLFLTGLLFLLAASRHILDSGDSFLHFNIINTSLFKILSSIIVILYVYLLPFLYQRKKKVKEFVCELALPIPRFYQTILYLLIFIISYLINLSPEINNSVIFEFGVSWLLLLMTLTPLNRDIFSRKTLHR